MKIFNCDYAELINETVWRAIFNVTEVKPEYIEVAKQIDGDGFAETAFVVEAYYDAARDIIDDTTELMYITETGHVIHYNWAASKTDMDYMIYLIKQVLKDIPLTMDEV